MDLSVCLSVPVCVCVCVCVYVCAYLSGAQSDHQVRDEGVFSLSGAMADHHTPTTALSQLTPERQTGGREEREIINQWVRQTVRCTDGQRDRQVSYAWMDSVTEPIWFTLSSRQLQAFLSTACWILLGLVTVRSSPTI